MHKEGPSTWWLVPPAETAARASRQLVRRACAGLNEESLSTAVLLVDELVVNAFRHGLSPVTLSVTRSPSGARVGVCDVGPALPHVSSPGPLEEGGRGLQLVEALARRWGVTPTAGPQGGKWVWFEV